MKYRNSITSIIPIFISLACLYVFFSEVDSFNNFFIEIKNADYLYILIATFLLLVTVFLRSLRWNILLKYNSGTFTLFKVQMIGYFANNVLPFRAGELLKSFLIGRKEDISKSYVLGTIIIERFLDMLMLLVFTIVYILISPISMIGDMPIYYLLIIILATIAVLFLLLIIIAKVFSRMKLTQNFISKLTQTYRELTFSQFLYVNFYGILIWLIYWFNVELVFRAFNIPLEPHHSLVVLIVASIINSIPSLPGSIGTFHIGVGTTIVALDFMGNSSVESFTTVLHLYGYISLTALGIYYFIIDKTVGIGEIFKFKRR